MRIVLVDPLGDILFSGESLAAGGAVARGPEDLPDTLPAPATSPTSATSSAVDSSEAMTERCPETMRSAGSGVYRTADRTRASTVPVIEDVGAQIRAEAMRRRLRRVG